MNKLECEKEHIHNFRKGRDIHMRIKTNVAAINVNRNQGIAQTNIGKSLEKLASGYSINRAGDNAAGLAISEKMRAQINGLDQSVRNVDDGIGMANTGEGALQEVHSMLHRLKTLAVESANGTYTSVARATIDSEREQLLEEIDRISSSTDFDGISLFDDSDSPLKPAPKNSQDTPTIDLQIGYSESEIMEVNRYYLGSKALELDKMDFKNQTKANEAVDSLEKAIQAVTEMRASFGANSVHLQHTKNSQTITSENMNSAESVIRDTNMTQEMTTYTSRNIIMQSSQAMLVQANAMPQTVLSMLQQ